MVNISRVRAFCTPRLTLLTTVASLGIAAVVVGGTFVPAFSKAEAAEGLERNFAFPPNSQMEQFFRDWSFPPNSQMEQFFRRFGMSDTGQVTRGWIGVQIQPVTAEIADGLGLKGNNGALVVEPQAGSPAAKAGIKSGDVITAVNGTAVKDARDLAKQIGSMSPGTTAKLTVWRNGEDKSISLTLGEPPKDREARAAASNSSSVGTDIPEFGLMLAPAGQVAGGGSEGLMVTEIDPNGLASERGVNTGDVILDVGGNKVASPADVRNAISDAQKNGKRMVLMRLKSGEVTRFVAIPIARA
jgi:serine protease Do